MTLSRRVSAPPQTRLTSPGSPTIIATVRSTRSHHLHSGDPQQLGLTLEVNGVRRQNGMSATMIFDVWHIVHYLSRFITLEAGDVVTLAIDGLGGVTGTGITDGIRDMLMVPNDPTGNVLANTGEVGKEK